MNAMLLLAAKPAKTASASALSDPLVLGFLAILIGPFILFLIVALWIQGRKNKRAAQLRALNNRDEAAAFFAQPISSVETSLILQPGEHAMRTEDVALFETRAYRVYGGAGRRIGPIHLGAGASESRDRLRKIDSGTLTLTTKRLVFDGSSENRTFKLADILSVQRYSDGIEVSTQRRQKSLVFGVSNPLIWEGMIQAAAAGRFTVNESAPTTPSPQSESPTAAHPKPRAQTVSRDITALPRVPLGPGDDFDHAIVGESNYQGALRKVAGNRLENGETVVIPCLVVPEPENQHDPNAIAVYLEGGRRIGYFSREDAEEWAEVSAELCKRGALGSCEGFLRGGSEEKPSIGVWLSLREPEDLLEEWGG